MSYFRSIMLGAVLDKLWTTFRSFPSSAQVLCWVLLFPILGALYFWRRPGTAKGPKIVAGTILFLGSLSYVAVLSPLLLEGTPHPRETLETPGEQSPPTSPAPSSEITDSPPSAILSPTPIEDIRPSPKGIPEGTQRTRVARNVDGDTIWAEPLEAGSLLLGAVHKIRILEIDTPEIYGGTVQCYGPEASAFAKRELPVGAVAFLLRDKDDKDRYGRFLRYVWQDDGDFYNDMAVRTGHAKAVLYMPNDRYIEQLRSAEAEAKANMRGLWGACGSSSDGSTSVAPTPSPSSGNCHDSYPDFCIPPPPPDKNCPEFTQKNFTVRWDVSDPDPHKLDGNKNGKACEG